MATATQTRTGRCPTHGTVQATRKVPETHSPYIIYGITPPHRHPAAVSLPHLRNTSGDQLNSPSLAGPATNSCTPRWR